jgi:hypothetical protein
METVRCLSAPKVRIFAPALRCATASFTSTATLTNEMKTARRFALDLLMKIHPARSTLGTARKGWHVNWRVCMGSNRTKLFGAMNNDVSGRAGNSRIAKIGKERMRSFKCVLSGLCLCMAVSADAHGSENGAHYAIVRDGTYGYTGNAPRQKKGELPEPVAMIFIKYLGNDKGQYTFQWNNGAGNLIQETCSKPCKSVQETQFTGSKIDFSRTKTFPPDSGIGQALQDALAGRLSPAPDTAKSRECYHDRDVVTLRGLAELETIADTGRPSVSSQVLVMTESVCMRQKLSWSSVEHAFDVSRVRIVGAPPPIGSPISLTGRLDLAKPVDASAVSASLVVLHGKRLSTADIGVPVNESRGGATVPRCDAPPYGGTDAEFKAYVKNFGFLAVPTKILSAVCNAKYNGASRTGLYNVGLTDEEIDRESAEDVAVDLLVGAKNLVDKFQ